MKRGRKGIYGLLVASALAAGCRNGNGTSTSGSLLQSGGPPGTPVMGGGGGSGSSPVTRAIALPTGYEQPRGILFADGGLYVTARATATQKAAVLFLPDVGGSVVIATGDLLGTPNAMTDPVALAGSAGALYVADFSSAYSDRATGAILKIASGQISVVSAGSIDAPSGLLVEKDGSLVVCGADPTDGAGAVFTVQPNGTTAVLAKGGALTQPTGIGSAQAGTFFVSDAGKGMARAQLVSVSSGATPSQLTTIQDTCNVESGVVARGNEVFVAARRAGAGRISSVPIGGGPEMVAREGGILVAPQGVTTDGSSLYVADLDANGTGQIFVLQ